MTEKLVSIIIPAYNSQDFIGRCLDSVVSQTYNAIEIIVVDDGSTDRTLDIINEYKSKFSNIKVISQENSGLSSARNTGIKKANGEYILFVDSDDEICNKTVATCLVNFGEDIESVWFKTVAKCSYDDRLRLRYQKCINAIPKGKVHINDELMFRLCVNAWNKMFRAENFKKYNLEFPDGLYYEDNAFHYNYFSVFRNAYMIEDELYIHYLRKDSIMGRTRSKEEGMSVHLIWILKPIYEFWTRTNILNNREEFFERIIEKYIRSAIGNSTSYEKSRCIWEATKLLRELNLQYKNTYVKALFNGLVSLNIGVSEEQVNRIIMENENLKTENTDLRNHIVLLDDAISCNKKYIEDLKTCITDAKNQSDAKSKIIEDLEQIKLSQYNKIKELEEEKRILQNSNSYKIGRFFTYIPRKISKIKSFNRQK